MFATNCRVIAEGGLTLSVEAVVKSLNNKINVILTKRLRQRLEVIKKLAVEDLRAAVQTNVYDRRQPEFYQRSFQLLESITASDVRLNGNTIEFEIFFDNSKMNHTTLAGDTAWNGKKLNVAFLVDQGHYNPKGSIVPGQPIPWLDDYPGAEFIQAAIEKIKEDLRDVIKGLVKVEVKRIGKY